MSIVPDFVLVVGRYKSNPDVAFQIQGLLNESD